MHFDNLRISIPMREDSDTVEKLWDKLQYGVKMPFEITDIMTDEVVLRAANAELNSMDRVGDGSTIFYLNLFNVEVTANWILRKGLYWGTF